jgi:hypothetical protein
MHLGGSGARLVTYDAFDVRVAHKGPVLGEYAPLGEDEDAGKGVFRLRVTVPARGTTAMSECIRYDASETEMRQKLDALEPVAARGGVTVRRGGSGTDPMHYYGYTWRVELDETPTTALAEGPLNLELHCYGILENSCGCAETKIPLRDTVSGQSFCVNVPENGNNSRVDGNACAMRPTELRVERLTQAAYMQTQGMGDILVTGGTHRMPPRSNVAIHAAGGIVMVAGDQIDWYKLSASKFGKLKVLGIGWESWESSILLYRPGWATNREYSVLNFAPAFNMSSVFFMLEDSAQLLLTCPGSSLYLGEGSWDGGVIAGRATVFISRKVTMETPTVKVHRRHSSLYYHPHTHKQTPAFASLLLWLSRRPRQ